MTTVRSLDSLRKRNQKSRWGSHSKFGSWHGLSTLSLPVFRAYTELSYTNNRLTGLHSVVLTTYCMYSTVSRVCKPALQKKTTYYLRQNVGSSSNFPPTLLHCPTPDHHPSTPPPTLISNPLPSAVHVKNFLSMALVFSLPQRYL